MKTKAESALEFIKTHLDAGRTIYIGNPRHTTKITPKLAKRWEDAGKPLFKIYSNGELWLSTGTKSAFIIASKTFAHSSIKAQ